MSKRNKTAQIVADAAIESTEIVATDVVDLNAVMGDAADELEAELSAMESEGAPVQPELETEPEVVDEPTEEEVAAVVNAIEAQDAANEEAPGPDDSEEDDGLDEDEDEAEDLEALVDAVPTEQAAEMKEQIGEAFDDRSRFERSKNGANESIQASLKKSRAALDSVHVGALFAAINVDPNFINGSRSTGSGYNVYAIDKVADLVKGLNTGIVRNAINVAVCRSLFRFRAAGETFTGEMARAAASDKLRVTGAIKAHLVRHTVSASTAPTQASSTMSALETLGIVVNKGAVRSPVYELTESAQTAALAKALGEPFALAA